MDISYAGYLTPNCIGCRHWMDGSKYDLRCAHPTGDCRYLKTDKTKRNHLYYYDGPVMRFDDCLVRSWNGTTSAVSKEKARANLTYQWKIATGYSPRSKITLPGTLILID